MSSGGHARMKEMSSLAMVPVHWRTGACRRTAKPRRTGLQRTPPARRRQALNESLSAAAGAQRITQRRAGYVAQDWCWMRRALAVGFCTEYDATALHEL